MKNTLWTTTTLRALKDDLLSGSTYAQAGSKFNISRQRVKQIVDSQHWLDEDTLIGVSFRTDTKRKEKEAWNLKYHGDKCGRSKMTSLMRQQKKKYILKRNNAIRLNKEFSILFGEIHWPTYCPVLGVELDYFTSGAKENSASLDRIDPSKGYIKGNVVVMSWRANRVKNNGNAEEHLKIYQYLTNLKDSGGQLLKKVV